MFLQTAFAFFSFKNFEFYFIKTPLWISPFKNIEENFAKQLYESSAFRIKFVKLFFKIFSTLGR